ncbi:MAG: hypothetical protein ACOX6T_01085 [Myxococcales bacterium]|jgi:hypothetical protein
MSSKAKKPEVVKLFEEAEAEGVLSPESMQVLGAVDLGAQIQAGLGIGVDDVEASEVLLLTVMPDDSGSIAAAGNEQAVRDGHNLVLDALLESKQRDCILAHTRYLNGEVLFPYRPILEAVRMTRQNYQANLGTPLYDQAVVLLGSVLAKTQEFSSNGVAVRSVTLLITDGADQHSVRSKPRDVAALVRDLQRAESPSSPRWASPTGSPTCGARSARWESRTAGSSRPATARARSAGRSRSSRSRPCARARPPVSSRLRWAASSTDVRLARGAGEGGAAASSGTRLRGAHHEP